MKKFTLISAIILTTNFLYSQWVQLENFSDYDLLSVFFTDANTGYVVGDNGTIAKTSDGGMNWDVQTVGGDFNVFSVHFPDNSTGYALGGGEIVLKTVDEGFSAYQR